MFVDVEVGARHSSESQIWVVCGDRRRGVALRDKVVEGDEREK